MNIVRFTFSRECIQSKVTKGEVEVLNKVLNPCNIYEQGKNFGPTIYSGRVRRKGLIHTRYVA
jgi:hypothetical protein